jgi:hypothetical protein
LRARCAGGRGPGRRRRLRGIRWTWASLDAGEMRQRRAGEGHQSARERAQHSGGEQHDRGNGARDCAEATLVRGIHKPLGRGTARAGPDRLGTGGTPQPLARMSGLGQRRQHGVGRDMFWLRGRPWPRRLILPVRTLVRILLCPVARAGRQRRRYSAVIRPPRLPLFRRLPRLLPAIHRPFPPLCGRDMTHRSAVAHRSMRASIAVRSPSTSASVCQWRSGIG